MFPWIKKLFGFKSEPQVLTGTGFWGFIPVVEGNDIVVRGAVATWFGGADDPEDNGETASGVSTKKRPAILGCALPMNFGPCAGSPLPRLPWGTWVEVVLCKTGEKIMVPVIDLGPARGTGHAIDLTPAAFEHFAPRHQGKIKVDYRIPGGAKWIRA